jgi:hypothetical protein
MTNESKRQLQLECSNACSLRSPITILSGSLRTG